MRAIDEINAPKGLDLSWRLQSLANMAKQKIGPLLGFSRVFVKFMSVASAGVTWPIAMFEVDRPCKAL